MDPSRESVFRYPPPFRLNGATWAMSNQWSKDDLPRLDRLLEKNPQARVRYSLTADA
jgi:hypothetical protein